MKKNLSAVLAAVSCILLVCCLFQNSRLNQRINTLEGNLTNQIVYIRNDVNRISSTISTSLAEQASLLAESSWEYGEADYNALTVELICSASPKAYAADTQAVIVVNGIAQPMSLSGGAFKAKINIPLFGETHAAKLMLHESDVTRTEMLNWYLSPRYDYLLNVYANFNGSATGSPRDGTYHYKRSGVINIEADSKQPNGVKTITLVQVMNGKELGRTAISTDNSAFFENHQNPSGARPEPINPAQQSNENPVSSFYYELKENYVIPYGSTWMLYIEIEDSNGLFYRNVLDCIEISDSGQPTDDPHLWDGMGAGIYDADGNVLYEPNTVLYQ